MQRRTETRPSRKIESVPCHLRIKGSRDSTRRPVNNPAGGLQVGQRHAGDRQIAQRVAARGRFGALGETVEQLHGLAHGIEAVKSLAGPTAESSGSGLCRIGIDRCATWRREPPCPSDRARPKRPIRRRSLVPVDDSSAVDTIARA